MSFIIKILPVFTLLILTLQAELPPYVYANYQKNAPEALMLSVKKVKTSLVSFNEKSVTVTAKVLRVERSESKVKRGETITIVYTTTFWKPGGWVGPSSLPILKEEETVRAFLRKGKNNDNYYPDARGKSFK